MVYEVIVDISNSEVDKIFDYGAPFSVRPGMRVLVPFGRRQVEGFVIGTKEKSDYDVKDIILKLDEEPVVLPEMLDLMRWMSRRNLRLVDCLRLFIPSKLRGGRVKVLRRNFVLLADGVDVEARLPELARAPKQQEVLLALKEGGSFESELTKRFSPAAIDFFSASVRMHFWEKMQSTLAMLASRACALAWAMTLRISRLERELEEVLL